MIFLVAPFCSFTAPNRFIEPRVRLQVNDGFCEGSTNYPLVPAAGDPAQIRFWGQYCHVWEQGRTTALAKTAPFIAPKVLRLYSIGWTKSPTLSLERMADGTKFLIVPWDEDLYRWSRSDYFLPADWQGREVRLVAEGVPPAGLWRAFSEPLESDGRVSTGDASRILRLTFRYFCEMTGCALALTALAVLWGGVRNRVQAGMIALAGMAVPGYCVFWFTLAAPRAGGQFAIVIMIAAVLVLFACLWKLDSEGRAVLQSLIAPLLLVGVAALLVQASGFLYGGWQDPLNKTKGRYLLRLPPDNELPLLLAEGARLPHVPSPLQGDWLSSDRPPLQSGMVLAQIPRLSAIRLAREQSYNVVGVLAQSLWIFALWLLLTACGLDKRAIALTLAACLFSGFVFLNTFFVWPKLLAAAFTLGFLAAFVDRVPAKTWWLSFLLPGTLCAFALLAHGGSVFALLPAVPLLLIWRRPRPVKRLTAALLFALILYSPWMLYQKFYDPPGNRLLKIHLAGVEKVDSRPFGTSLAMAYGALSWRQIVDNKEQNFRFSFEEGLENVKKTALLCKALFRSDGLAEAAERGLDLRHQIFFHPVPCLGLFLFAPLALLVGIRQPGRTLEWRTAIVFWAFAVVATSVWCLLMFGPSSTSIHQGAYATMLLAIAAGVLSLWALSPKGAVVITAMQMAIGFLLNELLPRVPFPNGWLPEGRMHLDTLLLLLGSVLAVLGLLWKLAWHDGGITITPPLPPENATP